MNNQPLLLSIVIGIIVIFVIVGASLVAKLSNVNKMYKSESLKSIELAKENDELKSEVSSLKKDNSQLSEDKKTLEGVAIGLKEEISTLNIELEKVEKLKKVFEDKLKEELTRTDVPQSVVTQPKR